MTGGSMQSPPVSQKGIEGGEKLCYAEYKEIVRCKAPSCGTQ